MATIDNLTFAGQVSIDTVDIYKPNEVPINIKAIVDSITIYEDLFSPYITGNILLRDTHDMPNIFGRSGDTILKLVLHTPGIDEKFKIDRYFLIYKMADRVMTKDREQIYNLYFCSVEMLADINNRPSRQFKGNGHEIVNTLVKTILKSDKPIDFDPCSNIISYVSNFWNIGKNLSYISEHSISDSNVPGYLFYEDRYGFNFKDISKLASKEVKVIQAFNQSDFSADIEKDGINKGKVFRNPEVDYTNINGIRVDTGYDYIKDLTDGAISTKQYTNDVIKKEIKWSYYSRSTTNTPTLNEFNIYRTDTIDGATPVIMSMNRAYGLFGNSDASNYRINQQRVGYFRGLQSSKIEIDVYGRFDYTVGKKVSIDINQAREILKGESADAIQDKVLSGNYVITAISHRITREKHESTLECAKDSTILIK